MSLPIQAGKNEMSKKVARLQSSKGGLETANLLSTNSGLGGRRNSEASSMSVDVGDPKSEIDPSSGLISRFSQYKDLTANATLVASNQSLKEQYSQMISEGDGNTSSALTTGLDLDNLNKNLLGKKGSQAGAIASQSYFNDPVDKDGFTRNAGGAPESDQKNAIETIITVGRRLDATEEEIALALSFARYESGFNIYAAAKSSSAYGLGQFIDETGSGYGLNEDNKDDLNMQAQALIEFTQYNVDLSKKRGKGLEYVYKYHHDGPNENSGGLSKSKQHIMPFYPKYLELVRESI